MDDIKKAHQHLMNMLIEFSEFCTKNQLEFFLVGGSALGAYRHGNLIPWDDDIDLAMVRADFEQMENMLKEQHNLLPHTIYSPVEKSLIPEAPVGHLYRIEQPEDQIFYWPKIDIHPIDNAPPKGYQRFGQKLCSAVYYLGIYRLPAKHKGVFARYMTKIALALIPDFLWNTLNKCCKRAFTHWNTEESSHIVSLFGVSGYKNEIMPRKWVFPLKLHAFGDHEFLVPGDGDRYLQRLYGDWKKPLFDSKRFPKSH